MAQCPQCQSQVEIGSEYYGGLFTCPSCRAVYFISFDGVPESGGTQPTTSETEFEPYVPEEFPPLGEINQTLPATDLSPVDLNPFQEVVDFANSESPLPLTTFSVVIRGLELAQNIQDLRDILSDSKLGLSFDEFRSKIKKGEVKLEKLNPAQAAIIAFRLRPLALEMKWEQEVQ